MRAGKQRTLGDVVEVVTLNVVGIVIPASAGPAVGEHLHLEGALVQLDDLVHVLAIPLLVAVVDRDLVDGGVGDVALGVPPAADEGALVEAGGSVATLLARRGGDVEGRRRGNGGSRRGERASRGEGRARERDLADVKIARTGLGPLALLAKAVAEHMHDGGCVCVCKCVCVVVIVRREEEPRDI